MARLVVDDQQDDSEFVYAKAKIDEQIAAIVGPKTFSRGRNDMGEMEAGTAARMCPNCGEDCGVYKSKVRFDGSVRRWRKCRKCGTRFTTIEKFEKNFCGGPNMEHPQKNT